MNNSRHLLNTSNAMRSKLMNKILVQAGKVADTAQSVVIVGEYGSGKSWLARKIHAISNRNNKPFLRINCNTMLEEDACKQLFGYLAFTEYGAKINRGLLEQGKGGTLFLEGFDSFSESLQWQIIESIEKKEVFHVGSSQSVPVDIRIIGSMDIKLFYQAQTKYNQLRTVLNDIPAIIFHPPLRHRREEIAWLIDSFLEDELSLKYDFVSRSISPRALYLCIQYDWPGNVQQLKNAIEHAAVISAGNSIQPEHLPASVMAGQPTNTQLELLKNDLSFRTAEKQMLLDVLKRVNSELEAAQLLGLDLTQLQEKITHYRLLKEHLN